MVRNQQEIDAYLGIILRSIRSATTYFHFGSCSVLSEYLIEVTGKYLSLLEAAQAAAFARALRIDQTYWKSDFVLLYLYVVVVGVVHSTSKPRSLYYIELLQKEELNEEKRAPSI